MAEENGYRFSLEDFGPINENFTSNICYLLSDTYIKLTLTRISLNATLKN